MREYWYYNSKKLFYVKKLKVNTHSFFLQDYLKNMSPLFNILQQITPKYKN
jgi:hypothetical protein